MIDWSLSFLFILIGLLNILVFYYIRIFFYTYTKSLRSFIELNQINNYDLEKLLKSIDKYKQVFKLTSYGYSIHFQDQLLVSHNLNLLKTKKNYYSCIVNSDYKVEFILIPKINRGEHKEKNQIFFQTIKLLIQENLIIKTKSIDKSFENISKFHTFILHDTKNISQFFNTLSYNLDNADTPEKKDKLIEYLKVSTKILNNKSNKVLKLLELNSEENIILDQKQINLREFIQDIVDIYQLTIKVSGEIFITQSDTLLYMVFENIIKNFADKKLKERSIKGYITIEETSEHITIKFEDTGSKIENLEKIFEPFYTTKNGGLGIGLYKVKSLLKSINGSIKVYNNPNVTFLVTLTR